jgi:hypothetical protein
MNFYEQIFSRGRATGEGMTHFERLFAAKFGGSPPPEVREYTGAVPVTITADGTPLIDYLISGNTTQSGTPTPDSPIMPEGCGERTGNLCPVSTWTNSQNTDTRSFFQIRIIAYMGSTIVSASPYVDTSAPGIYTASMTLSEAADRIVIKHNGTSRDLIIATVAINGTVEKSYTVSMYVETNDPTILNGIKIKNLMLNPGSTALPYEPYGIKIPISSAGQTNNIYLGEVETTRRIKKYEFTGTEIFRRTSAGYFYAQNSFPDYNSGLYGVISALFSHYKAVKNSENGNSLANNQACLYAYNQAETPYKEVYIRDTRFTTADEFNSYLAEQYAAGTPVTIWYVLANEETAVVNEPLMRIGDYADTVSKAQAGVSIPTSNGSTTVDVDTTVKPSEVYIKYMG